MAEALVCASHPSTSLRMSPVLAGYAPSVSAAFSAK
jgi:hypothetical protein